MRQKRRKKLIFPFLDSTFSEINFRTVRAYMGIGSYHPQKYEEIIMGNLTMHYN